MASEYLISKWKVWWKSLDVNHDGSISEEDRDECRKKFCELHHLHDDVKKRAMDLFGKWWDEFIFRGKTGQISESEFLDSLRKDYEADKEKFRADVLENFSLLFKVCDTDGDGTISEEEYILAFKAYGHENTAQEHSLYDLYKPDDGHVPISQVVDSWVQLVVNDDPSQEELVLNALQKGA